MGNIKCLRLLKENQYKCLGNSENLSAAGDFFLFPKCYFKGWIFSNNFNVSVFYDSIRIGQWHCCWCLGTLCHQVISSLKFIMWNKSISLRKMTIMPTHHFSLVKPRYMNKYISSGKIPFIKITRSHDHVMNMHHGNDYIGDPWGLWLIEA